MAFKVDRSRGNNELPTLNSEFKTVSCWESRAVRIEFVKDNNDVLKAKIKQVSQGLLRQFINWVMRWWDSNKYSVRPFSVSVDREEVVGLPSEVNELTSLENLKDDTKAKAIVKRIEEFIIKQDTKINWKEFLPSSEAKEEKSTSLANPHPPATTNVEEIKTEKEEQPVSPSISTDSVPVPMPTDLEKETEKRDITPISQEPLAAAVADSPDHSVEVKNVQEDGVPPVEIKHEPPLAPEIPTAKGTEMENPDEPLEILSDDDQIEFDLFDKAKKRDATVDQKRAWGEYLKEKGRMEEAGKWL